MGKHRISLGRRGVAALAAAGALVIGGTTASMMGTGSAAEPPEILAISSPTNTIVLPGLKPFEELDVRGTGKGEVSDEVGAPTGGGKAALRLSTPVTSDKVSYSAPVTGAATSLAAWIPTAAYSAYKLEGGAANQFPSLQLTVDPNGPAEGGFSTLTYEPVYNTATDSLEPGQWNRYQAGAGLWCSTQPIEGVITKDETRCNAKKPLADFVRAAPDLVVTGVVINQGSGNPGVESAVDLVSTPDTTYDFELTKPVVVVPPVESPDPTAPPTTKPGNGNGGGHPGNGGGNNGGHPGNGGNNGGHPGNGNGGNNGNGGWGQNGHCGC